MINNERYRRAKVLTNIDVIQEKLENIRSELRTTEEMRNNTINSQDIENIEER